MSLSDNQLVTLRQLSYQREPKRAYLWNLATLRSLRRRGLVEMAVPHDRADDSEFWQEKWSWVTITDAGRAAVAA